MDDGLVRSNERSSMIGHNHGGWIMPGELESYLDNFYAAQKSWIALQAALGNIVHAVESARSNPRLLLQWREADWPTLETLKSLYGDFQSKFDPLEMQYARLPSEYRERGNAAPPRTIKNSSTIPD